MCGKLAGVDLTAHSGRFGDPAFQAFAAELAAAAVELHNDIHRSEDD